MALISPLKADIDKATRELEALTRLYNVYFQGGEEDPPRQQRKSLDAIVAKIKSQMPMASNAGDKFQANALYSRYQTMAAKWDKHLRGIEAGTIVIPKNRE
ncbi:MAG: hypothetical protein ACXVB9_11695 [Bdellovibrionota bacterium]